MLRRALVASLALTALATGCVDPEDLGDGDPALSGPESESGSTPAESVVDAPPRTLPASPVPAPRSDLRVIARDEPAAQNLALHGAFLYFVTLPAGGGAGASIARVSRGGGTIEEVVRGHDPWGFGFDRYALYWADLSAKAILASSRSGAPARTVVDAGGAPALFAMDATHVYWATPDGEIGGASKATPAVESIASLGDTPLAMAIDGSFVYVAAADVLYRVSRGGGDIEKLAVDESFGSWLVVDEHAIYWASPRERTIRRLDKGAATPVTLAWQVDAAGAALATDWLYFTDTGAGAVKKVLRRGGSEPLVVAAGQNQPSDIAADETGAYWVNAGSGTMMWAPAAL